MDLTSIIATVTTVALGVSLVWSKVDKILKAMAEVAETLTAITKALEDKKLTADEIALIKQEVKEDIAALKAILK